MFTMSLTIKLVVLCGSYTCGSLHIFQSFRTGNLPLTRLWDSMSSTLYVRCPLMISFFLGLVDRALINLYLRPDSIHILAWNQILVSS